MFSRGSKKGPDKNPIRRGREERAVGSPIFLLWVAENPGNNLRPISPPRTVLRRTYRTRDDALTEVTA